MHYPHRPKFPTTPTLTSMFCLEIRSTSEKPVPVATKTYTYMQATRKYFFHPEKQTCRRSSLLSMMYIIVSC